MNETLTIQPLLDRVLSSAVGGAVLLFGLCAIIFVALMLYDARAQQTRFEMGRNAALRRLLELDERDATNKARQVLAGGTARHL